MRRIDLDGDGSTADVVESERRKRTRGDDVLVLLLSHRTGTLESYEYVAANPRFAGDTFDGEQPKYRPINLVGLTKGADSDPELDIVHLGRGTLFDDEGTITFPEDRS